MSVFNVLRPLAGSKAALQLAFDEFYAATLRPSPRLRSEASAVKAAYSAWAAMHGQPDIGFKDLKLFMQRRGHRHFYSNRAWYDGVAIEPNCAAGAPRDIAVGQDIAYALGVLAQVDLALATIDQARADLCAARDRVAEALP